MKIALNCKEFCMQRVNDLHGKSGWKCPGSRFGKVIIGIETGNLGLPCTV